MRGGGCVRIRLRALYISSPGHLIEKVQSGMPTLKVFPLLPSSSDARANYQHPGGNIPTLAMSAVVTFLTKPLWWPDITNCLYKHPAHSRHLHKPHEGLTP